MIHPDQLFKNTLHDHETPLGERTSFQGVMKKREKKRRAFFWFSLSSVLLLLMSLTATAMFNSSGQDVVTKDADHNAVVSAQKGNVGGDESPEGANQQDEISITQETQAAILAKPERADQGIGKMQAQSLLTAEAGATARTASEVLKNEAISQEASNAKVSSVVNTVSNSAASTSGEEQIFENPALDWLKMFMGRGIADEYVFQIAPTEGSVIPEFVPYYPPPKAKFNPIFELNITTAGNGYKYFRESKDITVAGNHRFSQYHAMMLFDLGRGVNVGGGIGYMENVGIGKALISEWKMDSAQTMIRVTNAANISYRMNKLSLPLGIRYQLGFGRSMIRISATAMPGVVTLASGKVFSRDAIQSMDNLKKNSVVFDARIGAGLYYQVAPKTAISAEPMLQYQSVAGAQWKPYNRIGFGFGLGVVFKP